MTSSFTRGVSCRNIALSDGVADGRSDIISRAEWRLSSILATEKVPRANSSIFIIMTTSPLVLTAPLSAHALSSASYKERDTPVRNTESRV